MAGVGAAGGQIGSITASGARQAEGALRSLGGTAKEVFTIFTGFALGNLFIQGIERIKAFATETAKLGLEAKVQEDAFARLSQSVGVAGDVLVAQMQKASGGILNTSDVMIAAAKALIQSLQPEQIVNLMTIARQQSKLTGIGVTEAFNQITQAIANQQPRALKQLGIVVDMDAAFKKHAATLGVEVERLNELGKTQAIYNAVVEQTKNSVKALTDEGLSQSEMVQKMAGQWKQAKEDVGKFVVDTGFAILAWFSDMQKLIPDLTAATQQMGQIWSGVWGNLKLALAGIGENLVSVIIPSLKLALAAAAAFGVGLNAAFAATAGPAAFLSSVIGDLADKKWPDLKRATLEANVATAEARVRLAESIDGFQKLKDGTAAASVATKDMAGAAGMGANKLADVSNQIKPLILSLKDLAAAQLAAMLQQQASVTAAVAMEEALAQQGVALHQLHESDLTMVQQKALDIRAAALQQQYGLELNLARQQGVSAGKAVADVEAKYIKSFSDIAVARLALSTAMQKAVADEMHAEFQAAAALTNGPAASTQPLLDAMDAWSKLGIEIDKVNEVARIDGDEQKRLADSIGLTRAALDAVAARFGATSDDAELMRLRLHGLLDEMTRLQTFRATAETVAEAWSFVADASSGATIALGDYSTALGIAEQESQLLGKGLGDELSTKIAITEQAILKAAKAFGVESDAVKLLQERLAGLKVDQFIDDMNQIGAQAFLLGNRFDGAGAEITRFQKLLVDKLKETNNVITPEVAAIAAQLNGMIDAKKMTEALGLTRTTFDDMVDAARSTASAMHAGFSDGFFDLFTGQVKSLTDVFASFGKSMLRVLADFLASSVVRAFLGFLGEIIGGFGNADGSGWLGGIASLLKGATGSAGGAPGSGTTSSLVSAGASVAKWVVSFFTDSATPAVEAFSKVGAAFETGTKSVSAFSSALNIGLSAIGVGLGIYNLAAGGGGPLSKGISAAGTALSAYSLASSIATALGSELLPSITSLVAKGFAAVAPSLSAALSPTLSAISTTLSGLAAPLAIAGALVSMGLAGKAADAEDAAIQDKGNVRKLNAVSGEMEAVAALFADVHSALSTENLPATIHLLHDALRDMGNLQHAAAYGADGIMAMTDEWRARSGALFLAALDAAHKQGLNVTPGFQDAPNTIGETLQSPYRLAPGAGTGAMPFNLTDLILRIGHDADAQVQVAEMLSHLLEITKDQAMAFAPSFVAYVKGESETLGNVMGSDFWRALMTPEHLAQIEGHGGVGDLASGQLDPVAINALLDKEYLTVTIRNAIVDVGKMFGLNADQFAAAGLGRDVSTGRPGDAPGQNWHMLPGDSTGHEWTGILPSVAAIAEVQQRLKEAGFEPGNYGKALQDFLVSVDANVVNNPAWKIFTDALQAGDAAADPATITNAVNAATVAMMTPLKFYDLAKVATDDLTAKIASWTQSLANMVAAGESQANIDVVTKQLEAMKAGVQAYSGLVTLFTALPGEMAAITGDLEAQTDAAVAAWAVTVQALGDNIQAAQKAFDEALGGGNIIAIQATAQQLHDATIAGYQMMLKAVEQINAAIKGILDQAAGLVDMQTALAQHDITAHGSFAGITRLLGGLQGVAEHGATAAEQMWAVDQALKAIIAVLPTAIAKFGNLDKAAWLASGPQTAGQLRAAGPSQITGSVATAAAPFLAVQQAAINAATGGNRLALLQQQAAAWNNLANAAIAGVNQWAQQAIAGAQEAAAAVIEGLAAEKDAKLAAIDAQISSIQKAADAEQAMRAEQMAGLQEAIAKADEFAAAIKQMGDFIQGLKVGPLGPGNPADKLAIAQDGFAKALAAYNANPTAQGLSGLQGLAQTMLSLAEPIFSKPSPQFQALAATTIKQLTAAQAMAAAIATDAEVLRSQLALLQALDKTAAQAAKDQIDALTLQKQSITDDFEAQTKAINAVLKTQIEAIEQAAKDEIDGIQNALAVELQKNFDQQVPLLKAQYDAATAQLAAIGDTKIWQDAALGILQGIYDKLATAIPAESGMDRVTEGLYHLHDGEMVLPKRMADQVRSAAEGAGMSFVPPTGNNDWTSPYSQPRDLSKEGAAWGGPRAADLNRLELSIRQMQANFEAQLAHNESRLNGKIHRNFSAEALAGMQGTLAAQIAAIRAQQQTIIASVPKTPPPGTPGTTPPPTPPYVPPGPGWLSRTEGAQQSGTQTIVFQITGSKEDAEAIKETIKQVLPAVLADAKNGKLGSVIDARAKSVR